MKKISIKIKLFVSTILILIITVIAISSINIIRFKSIYIEALLERARADAHDIRQGIYQGLQYFPLESFSDMTEFLNKHLYEKFSYASILSNEQVVLYHTDSKEVGKQQNKEIYDQNVFDDNTKNAIVSVGQYYEMVIPIVDPKEFAVVGTVNIGIEKSIVDDKVFDMIVKNVVILILAILFATAILLIFITRNISNPISTLEKKIQSISDKFKLKMYDEKKHGDEIEEFSYSFDTMTQELEQKTLELEEDIAKRIITEQKLKESYAELEEAFEGSIQAIATAVESRDPYTAGHQQRVAELAVEIAKKIGLNNKKIKQIYFAAMSHDIGKIGVPIDILVKKAKLTDEEFDAIKRHPQIGYDILKKVDFKWPLADIVRQHHERINGKGYPQGLNENEILLEAKIIAVADVVEAISKARPYRAALGDNVAMEEIKKLKGIQFDPQIVEACVELFEKEGFEFTIKE